MTSPAVRSRLGRFWEWLSAPPDEVLADAAREGELSVAKVRVWVTLLLLMSPLLALGLGTESAQNYVGLTIALLAVGVAVILDRVLRLGLYRPRISFISAVADVSLVSMGLFAFWVIGRPIVAVNSRVIFECYFLAIGASALRYDPRVTIAAGAAAIMQHLGISYLVWATHGRDMMLRGSAEYGDFAWDTQWSRTIVLFGMTCVALAIVDRAQRLRRLSTGDRLTGLFNRAYAEEFLANEVLRTARFKSSLVIAMLDVDRFKNFNDSFGHAAGDLALKQVADVLRDGLRRSDVVARFGGEEILIVLPGTKTQAGLDKLDEVRVTIGLTELRLPRGGTARITVSIGVAAFGVDGDRVDALLDVADARLYEAKNAGRNRVFGPVGEGTAPG